MNALKELWGNKLSPQGRLDITLFFVNLFLLIVRIYLMIIYVSCGNLVMVRINIASLLFYLLGIYLCYKKQGLYTTLAFCEIWIHMLCAVASFGWAASFQNWSFALIAAVYLPAFNSDNQSKSQLQSFLFTVIVVATYCILAVMTHAIERSTIFDIKNVYTKILFTVNNAITFFSIMMFAIFYTIRNDDKVRELSRKADFDQLTKIYNRHSLDHLGSQIIHNAMDAEKNYHVAIFDLDFFKKINDTYGHATGDIVLVQVANIIKSYSTRGIKCGRWGGEEFVMIAPHTMTYNSFTNTLEKIREKVAKTDFVSENNNKKVKVSVSIGADTINHNLTVDEAVSFADKNLYVAKKTGRNKLVK